MTAEQFRKLLISLGELTDMQSAMVQECLGEAVPQTVAYRSNGYTPEQMRVIVACARKYPGLDAKERKSMFAMIAKDQGRKPDAIRNKVQRQRTKMGLMQ